MTILGSVTRSAVSTIANPQSGTTNAGAFVARAGRTRLGFFPTLSDAKRAVNAVGGGLLRWSQENMVTGVEHWVARDTSLDLLDIAGEDLAQWCDIDANARVLDVSTNKVDLLGDRSGQLRGYTQSTPARQGLYVAGAANGYGGLLLTQASDQHMTSEVPLSPPFTIIVVANFISALLDAGTNLLSSDGANNWRLGVSTAGVWEYENSVGTILSGGTADTTLALLTVRQDTTGGEFRVNRAIVGGNADTPDDATTLSLGGAAATPSVGVSWGGLLAVVSLFDTTNITVVEQAERFVHERYNTP
ncbi:MAG: hypothetical protein JRD89_07040 [Deltaproteobacteria bacterium]|nr:hypothetical protein [Deltaproteobacteria bacterium]